MMIACHLSLLYLILVKNFLMSFLVNLEGFLVQSKEKGSRVKVQVVNVTVGKESGRHHSCQTPGVPRVHSMLAIGFNAVCIIST